MPFPAEDLTGKRFSRWLVKSRAPTTKRGVYWQCLCDCGQTAVVYGADLKRGRSQSCGCLSADLSKSRITHGEGRHGQKTPEYTTWRCMNARCHNPNSLTYARYGGRGIKVCKLWRESYSAFLAHVGRKPSPAHTIERIDNDKGYLPGNVRWATPLEQAQNTRQKAEAVRLTHLNQTLLLTEWAKKFGIDQSTLRSRLRKGWTMERALTEPTRLTGHKLKATSAAKKIVNSGRQASKAGTRAARAARRT